MWTHKVEKRGVNAAVYTTNGLKIEGPVLIGARLRLIDELNLEDPPFIGIPDAMLTSPGNGEPRVHDFIILNKREIVCVVPFDADANHPPAPEED